MATVEDQIDNIQNDIAQLKEEQKRRNQWRQRIAYVGWLVAGLAIGLGYKEWKDIPQQIASQVQTEVTKQVSDAVTPEFRKTIDNDIADANVAKDRAMEAASAATAAFGGDLENLKRINDRILVGKDNVIQILFPDRGRLQLENSSAFQYYDWPSIPSVSGPALKPTLLWARGVGFDTYSNAKPQPK